MLKGGGVAWKCYVPALEGDKAALNASREGITDDGESLKCNREVLNGDRTTSNSDRKALKDDEKALKLM